MNYFNINYASLKQIKERKYHYILLLISLIILILIGSLNNIYVTKYYETYGFYDNDILHIKIQNELSDALKQSKHIIFKNQSAKWENINFGNYEFINNEIYQNIAITLNRNFYQNEVGIVKIPLDKVKALKYVLDLFK